LERGKKPGQLGNASEIVDIGAGASELFEQGFRHVPDVVSFRENLNRVSDLDSIPSAGVHRTSISKSRALASGSAS